MNLEKREKKAMLVCCLASELRNRKPQFVASTWLKKKAMCVWRRTALNPPLRKQREVALCESDVSLGYRVRPCLKTTQN